MSKTKAKLRRAVVVPAIVYSQRPASAPELLPKEYPEIAEVVEEVLDRVDEASWGSFPASDAPGWIPTEVGSSLMVQHHNLCGAHYMVADPGVPVTATGRHQGVLVLTPATALSGRGPGQTR